MDGSLFAGRPGSLLYDEGIRSGFIIFLTINLLY